MSVGLVTPVYATLIVVGLLYGVSPGDMHDIAYRFCSNHTIQTMYRRESRMQWHHIWKTLHIIPEHLMGIDLQYIDCVGPLLNICTDSWPTLHQSKHTRFVTGTDVQNVKCFQTLKPTIMVSESRNKNRFPLHRVETRELCRW